MDIINLKRRWWKKFSSGVTLHHLVDLDLVGKKSLLVCKIVHNEVRGLANHCGLHVCGGFDSADHGASSRPLLRLRNIGHAVEVGGDEQTSRVLL